MIKDKDKKRREEAAEMLRGAVCTLCTRCSSGRMRDCFDNDCEKKKAVLEALKALESMDELEEYQKIGTVEECRKMAKRARGDKPMLIKKITVSQYHCSVCGRVFESSTKPGLFGRDDVPNYCGTCGQRLDWNDYT